MKEGADGVRARLLIVDDEGMHMRALCDTLDADGYATTGCESPAEALAAMQRDGFDLLLTDLIMPEMDGIALLRAARQKDPDVAAIVMTGHATIDTAVKAMQAGAYDYIVKPFRAAQLRPVVARAVEARQLRRANRELERRIRERSRELEVANRDLEAFSISVSHDLRAPLRAIQGFGEMLRERHGAGIPAEGQRLLQNMLAGADNLGQLIDGLLSFARSGREPLNLRPFAMGALVRDVVAELQRQHADRRVEVEMEVLPDCQGDAMLIRQVLVNLLGNAWKFTAGR
ncbi:MAG TPA: response regulator, partial [Steroidobacteraceae bacterium]|nr:response regulator [Steroidobacteraceae bacterium]